ncbi:glutaredoxin 3 [Marinivivus vitaminiproducens]|uniref:glutaredoxin 3 n=1 Tax=Marinivivus vitaminiproducens TaxID=3035935 RepID=UPI0027A52ABE|nr:glutaredoxin 3 [Geminicoccaceae bacterium SCSIO 64248]
MADVEIYTTPFCPYCWRAKRLLDKKGVAYREINVWGAPDLRQAMTERAGGRRTVPQIFIEGTGIGGSDDLAELDRSGRLDAMLEPA